MIVYITVLCTLGLGFVHSKSPVVEIPQLGKIEGNLSESLNGNKFYTFEGVPYARPPVGKYRFQESVPVKPWKGVWQAKTIYRCMQYFQYTPRGKDYVVGDEDCLYLNIYTPTLDNAANLDVVVYIHGGAFMFFHGANYGPHYIMDKNIVYINFNYRLGPLGFLSTENEIVPGNNGIKDQTLALKWIKDNVKYFGGNPNSITIVGMSAGGASVHTHYLTPRSRGLFNKGVSQSGTALNPWVLMEEPLEKSKKIAALVGCRTDNIEKMVECLRKRPGRQIVATVKSFQPWLYNPFSPFGLVVDKWASDPVLPEHPYELLRRGQVADLPWIASETNFEGLYPASDFLLEPTHLNTIENRWNELMPFILDYNYTVAPQIRDDVSQAIRRVYLVDQNLTRNSFPKFVDILSDRHFVVDIHKSVRLQSSATSSPVYFYLFTYRGANSWHQDFIGRHDDFGSAHAEDTAFLLSTTVDAASTEEDRSMIKLMVEMVVSFAKTGKPVTSVEWRPVDRRDIEVLEGLKIDSPTKLGMEKITIGSEKFWESLPINENEKLSINLKDEL